MGEISHLEIMALRPGQTVFFEDEGVLVEVVYESFRGWWVKQSNGWSIDCTADELRELGPWGCLCTDIARYVCGSGCMLCSDEEYL